MEQRNELLRQMRLSRKERQGEVQHILARSFSRRQNLVPQPESSPPRDILIQVPQIPPPKPLDSVPEQLEDDDVSIGELSAEPRVVGLPSVEGQQADGLYTLSTVLVNGGRQS